MGKTNEKEMDRMDEKDKVMNDVVEEKAVAVKQETSLSDMVNRATTSLGFEDMDNDILIVPRAKLMQALSPELDTEGADFKAGDIVHSLLLEKLDPSFIPLNMWNSRTMFPPRNDADMRGFWEAVGLEPYDTMMVCTARDGKAPEPDVFGVGSCKNCKYKNFGWDGNPDSKPLCTHTINVLALFDGMDLPAVFSFATSNFRHGRNFYSLAKYSGGAIFSKKYRLAPKRETRNDGTRQFNYYVTPVQPNGKPTEEELAQALQFYKQFKNISDIEIVSNDEDMEGLDLEY